MNRMTFSLERLSLTPALSRRERENYPPMIGTAVDRLSSWYQCILNKETGLSMNRIGNVAVSKTSRSAPELSGMLRLVPLAPHTAALRIATRSFGVGLTCLVAAAQAVP